MIPDFGGNLFNLHPIRHEVELSFTDMRDPYAMRYLTSGQEIIFNLAGQVSHIDSMQNPFQDLQINTISQLQLLEMCRQYNPDGRIVFTSTRQVYGMPQYYPVNEQHPTQPRDLNGIHKLAAEHYYRLYHEVYGMATVILRLTNTYGPRQLVKHNRQGFTGTFIRKAVQKEPIRLYGTGEQKRDFNYVDDVVEALLLAGSLPHVVGKIYNLGFPQPYSLKQFVLYLQELCKVDFAIVPFPEDQQKIDIGDYYADFTAFAQDAGWSPQIDLKEGLTSSIKFYEEFGHHYWN